MPESPGRRAPAIGAVVLLVLTQLLWPPAARAGDPRDVKVGFLKMSSGLTSPTAVVSAKDGTGRLFVTEQPGRIRVRHQGGSIGTYLDIRARVLDGGERGLLGLAFHPAFTTNGYLFVTYTDSEGDLRVSRFRASPPAANTVSASSELIVLQVAHRDNSNHNGGQLQFGSRYLYISTGDGGGAGDADGNAQDTGVLLGKILRINIDGRCSDRRYCIPSTNPFYGPEKPGRGEIWHYGLRNPWRFSFDRETWTQYNADVGQSDREEVNRTAKGVGGKNYGWDCREGTLDTSDTYGGSYCDGRTFTSPVRQYSPTNGRCAIIGGYVYRGSRYPVMEGMYLHGDYCSGEIWALARQTDGSYITAEVADGSGNITSFGEGATGEVYITTAAGSLYRLTATRR